jgi:hypothetical protein
MAVLSAVRFQPVLLLVEKTGGKGQLRAYTDAS